jgi:hypothetical protein
VREDEVAAVVRRARRLIADMRDLAPVVAALTEEEDAEVRERLAPDMDELDKIIAALFPDQTF